MAESPDIATQLKALRDSPAFQKLEPQRKALEVKQILFQLPAFRDAGPADQAADLQRVVQSISPTGAPQFQAPGELGQGILELGLETVGGVGGFTLGGIPGAAVGTAVGGQAAELFKPLTTGEAIPNPLSGQQLSERAVEAVGGGLANVTGATMQRGIATASNAIVRRALMKSGLSQEGEAAVRVAEKTGRFPIPSQIAADPRGFFSIFEDLAFESLGGDAVFRTARARQMRAIDAYLDSMSAAVTANLQPGELGTVIAQTIRGRQKAAQNLIRGAYGVFHQEAAKAGVVAINLKDLGRAIESRAADPHMSIVLAKLRNPLPEFQEDIIADATARAAQFKQTTSESVKRTVTAQGKVSTVRETGEKTVKGGVTREVRERVTPQATTTTEKESVTRSFGQVPAETPIVWEELSPTQATLLIQDLRMVARNSPDESIRNVANHWAARAEHTMLDQLPDTVRPLYEAARDFTAQTKTQLNNKLVTSVLQRAEEQPGTLGRILLKKDGVDTLKALRAATDVDIPIPQTIQATQKGAPAVLKGANTYRESVQPLIAESILKSANPSGNEVIGISLKKTLQSYTKETVDLAFTPGTYAALNDVADALTVAARDPRRQLKWFIVSAQVGAGVDLLVNGASSLFGDKQQGFLTPAADMVLLLSGPAFATALARPKTLRALATGIRHPGKNAEMLTRAVTSIATLSTAEDIAADHLHDVLQDIGAHLPPRRSKSF